MDKLDGQRCIPSGANSVGCEPTEETRLAMLRAEAKDAGLIPDDDSHFDNVEDFMRSLEA